MWPQNEIPDLILKRHVNNISDLNTHNIPPQMKNFIMLISILMHFVSFKIPEEPLMLVLLKTLHYLQKVVSAV